MGDINHECNEDSSIGDLLDIAEKIVEEEQLPCFPEHIADDPNSSFNGQWSKIVHLRQSGSLSIKEEIDKIWINCGVSISVRFREHFAKILERIRWDEVTHVSGTDSYVARKLYGVIGQELQTMVTSRDNFNYTLRGLHAKLADPYSQADIVHQIKHVMNKERWIIEQSMV